MANRLEYIVYSVGELSHSLSPLPKALLFLSTYSTYIYEGRTSSMQENEIVHLLANTAQRKKIFL